MLSDGLDPARFEQLLLAGSVGEGEGDYVSLRAPHLPVIQLDGLGRAVDVWSDVRAAAEIRRAIERFRPHIVHTHTAKAGALGRPAAWSCGVPATVHTFHGHLLRGYFSPAKTKALVLAERSLAHFTTRLVSVGAQVRDELLAAGVGRPGQFSVVPPGVDAPEAPSRQEARRRLELPADGLVVGLVARLTAVKRPDRFLAVAAEIARHRPATTFLVAGEGDLLDEMRTKAADLGLAVRFLGWRPDVEAVYAACDVVMLTSDNEGMPVSLIEAAFAGRPAVTTDVGSAPEVVLDGSTGFVVPADVGELVKAAERLLVDPELRKAMGTAAATHARDHFSSARLVSDIARLYEEIVEDKGDRMHKVQKVQKPA